MTEGQCGDRLPVGPVNRLDGHRHRDIAARRAEDGFDIQHTAAVLERDFDRVRARRRHAAGGAQMLPEPMPRERVALNEFGRPAIDANDVAAGNSGNERRGGQQIETRVCQMLDENGGL
jgi:hypothetical protein